MKKFKVNIVSIASIFTLGSILLTGCNSNRDIEARINDLITTDTSFTDVLDAVEYTTQLDENLQLLGYEDDLNRYTEARKKSNIEESSKALADLGKKILEASVCEHLGINISDVVEFNYYAIEDMKYTPNCVIKYYKHNSKKVAGNIDVDSKVLVEEKYYLGEEARDLVFNTYHAFMGHLTSEQEIDAVFKSFERYLLTSPKNKSEDEIMFEYDQEKIKKLEKIK